MRLSLFEFVAFCNLLIRALSHFHFPPRLASLESGSRYEGLYQHKREQILYFKNEILIKIKVDILTLFYDDLGMCE